jgi:hypothetical protein
VASTDAWAQNSGRRHSCCPQLFRIVFKSGTIRQEFYDSQFVADQLRYQKRQDAKLHAVSKSDRFELIPLEHPWRAPQEIVYSSRRSRLNS